MKRIKAVEHLSAVLLILCCILLISKPVFATGSPTEQPADYLALADEAKEIWGEDNVWLPSAKIWVNYEEDLGERSWVDFESGKVKMQLLIDADMNPTDELVMAHMRQGVRNLIVRDAEDPLDMYKAAARPKKQLPKLADPSLPKMVAASHDLELDAFPAPVSEKPVILDQVLLSDGSKVTAENVVDFAREKVTIKTIKAKKIKGGDGVIRQAVTVDFDLVPNHLEIRARKYHPLIHSQAVKYSLDPALIMAIVHTESMFNPRARSHAPAYGLMQLVPGTGALEAYRKVYGKNTKPSSGYLYDPENNIELGVAYFDILSSHYMKTIKDPESRTYCAVAAYNAGSANVGRTFVSKKSMNMASPVVNDMSPEDVYSQLVEKSHRDETRKYVRKVMTRKVLYASW